MRELSYRFRKSLLTRLNSGKNAIYKSNRFKFRSKKFKFILASISVVAIALSCAMSQDRYSNLSDQGIIESFVDKYFGNRYSLHVSLNNTNLPILKVSANSCESESTTIGIAVEVGWESLRFPIEIKATRTNSMKQLQTGSEQSTAGLVETLFITPQKQYSVRNRPFISDQSVNGLCEQINREGSSIELDRNHPLITGVIQALAHFSPDCNISLGPNGFTCEGSAQSLSVLQSKAFRTQEMVLNSFQRLPYLMVRKASTLRQFATVYNSENGLNGFCRVLSNSMQEEQPLAFRSNLWKKAVCSERKSENWKSVAADGVELAIRELRVLTAIAEETTEKGLISVKVPSQFRTVWVQLNPKESVAQSFQNSIRRNQSRQETTGAKGFCWHPIFDENPELEQIASAIGLFQRPTGPCEYIESDNMGPAWKYLANALNGETSFIVDNAKSKIVQLPLGDYKYTIYPMPQDPRSERAESGPQVAIGNLTWTNRAPKITLQ